MSECEFWVAMMAAFGLFCKIRVYDFNKSIVSCKTLIFLNKKRGISSAASRLIFNQFRSSSTSFFKL